MRHRSAWWAAHRLRQLGIEIPEEPVRELPPASSSTGDNPELERVAAHCGSTSTRHDDLANVLTVRLEALAINSFSDRRGQNHLHSTPSRNVAYSPCPSSHPSEFQGDDDGDFHLPSSNAPTIPTPKKRRFRSRAMAVAAGRRIQVGRISKPVNRPTGLEQKATSPRPLYHDYGMLAPDRDSTGYISQEQDQQQQQQRRDSAVIIQEDFIARKDASTSTDCMMV